MIETITITPSIQRAGIYRLRFVGHGTVKRDGKDIPTKYLGTDFVLQAHDATHAIEVLKANMIKVESVWSVELVTWLDINP